MDATAAPKPTPLRTILVATDFSATANLALSWAE